MNFKKLIEDCKPHFIAIVAFLIIGFLYFKPNFEGKTHKEEDVTQGLIKATEIKKYMKDGEAPGWTNSIFSGMPSTLIYGQKTDNKVAEYSYLTLLGDTAYPFKIIVLSFIGFYFLMIAFKVKPLHAALASLAYGFATYSISSIEAAHYTKVLAMALMPALMAALHWIFSGRYLLGGVLLGFHFALQIYYFHFQITFYSIITLLVMGVYYLIENFKSKNMKNALIATLVSVFAVGFGVLSNASKIKSTSDFAEKTMRGGNEMDKATDKSSQKETSKNGLNRDYAFSWSYGIGETFTLLIPNFYGGSSNQKLGTNSAFYEKTGNDEALEQGLPLYHGELGFTSGPIYIGAIIVFLFILGMVVIESEIKWALFALTIISFILAWGKHFGIINNFLFDHLIYYNKFRTPMMAMSIAQVTMPLIGFLGLKTLYENRNGLKDKMPKLSNDELWKKITYVFYGVGGFCLLMALVGPNIIEMGGKVDEELRKGGNGQIIEILKEDRASLLRADAFRSFIFIGLAFAILWAWFTKKVTPYMAIGIIGILATIDLVGVDARYLSWSDFKFEKGEAIEVEKDKADEMILQDKTLHYRVLDLTKDPFNDNSGAAFHKMIGGYDPAKLSRYQDIISELIADKKYQDKALDILNCKYLIGSDSFGRMPQLRQSANGNAWFISKLKSEKNAKYEMEGLKLINHKSEATFNAEFEANKLIKNTDFTVDSLNKTELLSYHPDTLKYNVQNSNNGFLVFSEIYDQAWKAKVDGKPTNLYKVNYTLRGIEVPAGNHKIELYFEKTENKLKTYELIFSSLIMLAFLAHIVLSIKSYFNIKTS